MYEKDWDSKDTQRQQMGCALYFIDQLALRAGHEKDEDEADTVGCCTLKVLPFCCLVPLHKPLEGAILKADYNSSGSDFEIQESCFHDLGSCLS